MIADHSNGRPIDELGTFTSAAKNITLNGSAPPARYAVRQVLQQEATKLRTLQAAENRAARSGLFAGVPTSNGEDQENHHATPFLPNAPSKTTKDTQPTRAVKRDFFGRVIVNSERVHDAGGEGRPGSGHGGKKGGDKGRIWVSYHEGFSNAVRKPIGLRELMEGL